LYIIVIKIEKKHRVAKLKQKLKPPRNVLWTQSLHSDNINLRNVFWTFYANYIPRNFRWRENSHHSL